MTRRGGVTLRGFVLLTVAAACQGADAAGDRSDASSPSSRGPLLVDHGIHVGRLIAPHELPCADGRPRAVAMAGRAQLVTFSTPGDCSECERHLQGVEEVYRGKYLDLEQFIVVYAPAATRDEALLRYRGWTRQPVCFDTVGSLWEAENISHTPITAVIRDGSVRYLDDGPLDTDARRASFLTALRASLQ